MLRLGMPHAMPMQHMRTMGGTSLVKAKSACVQAMQLGERLN